MIYTFEKNGKKITKNYPIGCAPVSVNGYKKIIEFPNVRFGKGCTRCNEPPESATRPNIQSKATVHKISRAEYDAI